MASEPKKRASRRARRLLAVPGGPKSKRCSPKAMEQELGIVLLCSQVAV